MTDVAPLVARLAAWRGGEILFTERLQADDKFTRAQQTFKLARCIWEGEDLLISGRFGHLLSLLVPAITRLHLQEKALTATEQLGPGVSRTSTFQLLALTDENGTSVSQAAHIWFGNSGSIRSLGGNDAEWFLDSYTRGASSLEPLKHARLRRQLERVEGEPVPASRAGLVKAFRRWRGRPIAFWVGPTLREQLAFWWACSVMAATNLELNAWFAGPRRSEIDPDPRFGLQVLPDEDLARIFGDAHPLSARAIQFFASRWSNFCRGRAPLGARIEGWPASKGWALKLSRIFDAPFPRVRRGVVRLSLLDEELLAPFASARWRSPIAVIRPGGCECWAIAMSFLGDSLPGRLREWAAIENGRYLASRPAPREGPNREWNRMEYRLTNEGRNALKRGVESTENIPTFPFGGFPQRLPAIARR